VDASFGTVMHHGVVEALMGERSAPKALEEPVGHQLVTFRFDGEGWHGSVDLVFGEQVLVFLAVAAAQAFVRGQLLDLQDAIDHLLGRGGQPGM
jgi:hypothetical protein